MDYPMSHPPPLLVILDLDETLFHTSVIPLDRAADFRIDENHTYKRPGVDEFLRQLSKDPRFTLAVWTSAAEDYAVTAVMNLGIQKDSLLALFSHDRCSRTRPETPMGFGAGAGYQLVKDLHKLERATGWPIERMIAIDDDPEYYVRQYSNLLTVEPYYGKVERQQGVFPALLDELARLHTLPNVRQVEKRRWYENYLKRKSVDVSVLSVLEQIDRFINCEGEPCDYGCAEEDLPRMIAIGKEMYPDKPYRVVSGWSWGDFEVNESQREVFRQEGVEPAFLFANQVVIDETGRFHDAVRTTPLLAFHAPCLFVTKNTVYILLGPGSRMTVDLAAYRIYF
jgi:hypothetical protein